MTKYRITPQAFVFGGADIPLGYPDELCEFADMMDVPRSEITGMMDSYTFQDYFLSGCGADDYYDSEADANAAYKGEDPYGIGVRFEVQAVECELA